MAFKFLLATGLLLSLAPGRLDDAKAALEQGDPSRAEAILREALRENPNDPDTLHLIGIAMVRQTRLPEAEDFFRKAIERDPDTPEWRLSLARLQRAQGRLPEAAATLEQALASRPKNPTLLYEKGQIQADLGNFADAARTLGAIPSEGAPAEYWDVLGRILTSAGDFEAAEAAYQRLLTQRPGSIRVLRALSGLAIKRGDLQRGWELIAQARREAPNSPHVLAEFVEVSLASNLLAEAVTAARLLCLLEPDEPSHLFLLGRALFSASEFQQSEKQLEEYLRLRPDDAEAHLVFGLNRFKTGNFADARSRFEEALRLNPGLLEADYYLGVVAYSLVQDQLAEEHLLRVLKSDPEHGRAHLTLGKLWLRSRRLEPAVEQLEKAAQLLPAESDVQFQLGRAFQQLGQPERARAAVERYRQLKEAEDQGLINAFTKPFSDSAEKP